MDHSHSKVRSSFHLDIFSLDLFVVWFKNLTSIFFEFLKCWSWDLYPILNLSESYRISFLSNFYLFQVFLDFPGNRLFSIFLKCTDIVLGIILLRPTKLKSSDSIQRLPNLVNENFYSLKNAVAVFEGTVSFISFTQIKLEREGSFTKTYRILPSNHTPLINIACN